nr:myristylated tegument protein [Equid gammaherpesvirus 5]UTK45606.1 myristylated tegument protein [Equid gammaherpesvirus 5]UTK45685.1 myristylated tegument protein [Equid gammaherpesvirus 5]UTK45763.1 myristylated tegument protein [Equid gammaherpesvirus 5]
MGILLSICRRRHDPINDVDGQPINVQEEFEMFDEDEGPGERCVFLNPQMEVEEDDDDDYGASGDAGKGQEPARKMQTTPHPVRKSRVSKGGVL